MASPETSHSVGSCPPSARTDSKLKVVLATEDSELHACLRRHCGDLAGVEVHHGSILDLEVDAIVSSANSFGFMDGGTDLLYSRHFGWDVQRRLQALIRKRHHGELLVGAAEIVPTGNDRIPFVVAAPTMRVPMILERSVNPYLAARAALLLVKHGRFGFRPLTGRPVATRVRSLAFPGLATGVGRVPPRVCALQVARAIEEVLLEGRSFPTSWDDAQARHQLLYTNKVRDLQFREDEG